MKSDHQFGKCIPSSKPDTCQAMSLKCTSQRTVYSPRMKSATTPNLAPARAKTASAARRADNHHNAWCWVSANLRGVRVIGDHLTISRRGFLRESVRAFFLYLFIVIPNYNRPANTITLRSTAQAQCQFAVPLKIRMKSACLPI